MSSPTSAGAAHIQRYLDPGRRMALSHGNFAAFFQVYQEHVERWELPMDGLALALMREGLASAALHLVTRPTDESFAVTVNIVSPPLNLFMAGDAGANTMTGRAFLEGVKTEADSRFFVQSHRPTLEPSQSTIDVQGLDVLGMFEAYYARSEQNPARFFDLDDDRYLFVLALPDTDPALVRNLDRDAARALLESPLTPLETREVVYRCGCTRERMLDALRSIFEGNADELFQGDAEVETFCPRCGARWAVTREAFESPENGG